MHRRACVDGSSDVRGFDDLFWYFGDGMKRTMETQDGLGCPQSVFGAVLQRLMELTPRTSAGGLV